jgi:hypothetical protein
MYKCYHGFSCLRIVSDRRLLSWLIEESRRKSSGPWRGDFCLCDGVLYQLQNGEFVPKGIREKAQVCIGRGEVLFVVPVKKITPISGYMPAMNMPTGRQVWKLC